jgi:hypothetical protein
LAAFSLTQVSRTGTLTIQDAGKVFDVNGSIVDGTVTVTGAGSAWTNSGDLDVTGLYLKPPVHAAVFSDR